MTAEDKPQCEVHGEQISQLRTSDDRQWIKLNEHDSLFRKYVPLWTTVILMVSSALTGSALTFAGMIIKFAGR